MDASIPPKEQRAILDEDIQIVRATLDAIHNDIGRVSDAAAQAIDQALRCLDIARFEFGRQAKT